MTDLTRVEFYATPRTIAALDQATATGDTRVDVLNRAVVVYAAIVRLAETGGGTLNLEQPAGTTRQVTVR